MTQESIQNVSFDERLEAILTNSESNFSVTRWELGQLFDPDLLAQVATDYGYNGTQFTSDQTRALMMGMVSRMNADQMDRKVDVSEVTRLLQVHFNDGTVGFDPKGLRGTPGKHFWVDGSLMAKAEQSRFPTNKAFAQDLRRFYLNTHAHRYIRGANDHDQHIATSEYLAELSYCKLRDGQVVNVPDVDGKVREYVVHEMHDDANEGFVAKVLAPLHPEGMDRPDIKVLFRGTHSMNSGLINLEEGGPANQTMKKYEPVFANIIGKVVEDVVAKTGKKVSITSAGHSQGGASAELNNKSMYAHILGKKGNDPHGAEHLNSDNIAQVNLSVVAPAGVSRKNAKAITELVFEACGDRIRPAVLKKPIITTAVTQGDMVPGSGLQSAGFMPQELVQSFHTEVRHLRDNNALAAHVANPVQNSTLFAQPDIHNDPQTSLNRFGVLGTGRVILDKMRDAAVSIARLHEKGGKVVNDFTHLIRRDRHEHKENLNATNVPSWKSSAPSNRKQVRFNAANSPVFSRARDDFKAANALTEQEQAIVDAVIKRRVGVKNKQVKGPNEMNYFEAYARLAEKSDKLPFLLRNGAKECFERLFELRELREQAVLTPQQKRERIKLENRYADYLKHCEQHEAGSIQPFDEFRKNYDKVLKQINKLIDKHNKTHPDQKVGHTKRVLMEHFDDMCQKVQTKKHKHK